MNLIESTTYHNLARAYSSECQAMVRYKFIEYGARYNKLNVLAETIDRIVYNEFNHARILYTKIQDASDEQIDNIEIEQGVPFREKWDLKENLRLAALDEEKEVTVYKSFAKTAQKEGFNEIAELFTQLARIEDKHRKTFSELYEQMNADSMYKKDKPVKWKCTACGYESFDGAAFDKCPVCQAEQGQVALVLKNPV
ncbi:MAG: hypothetical protein IJ811_03455 [Clostridia bacterium]|nr:hypothetical protein [Clostridia bacterium]